MSRPYMRNQQSSPYAQNPNFHQPGKPQALEHYQPTLQPCDESHYVDNSQINWHQSRTQAQPYFAAAGHNAERQYAIAQDFGHQEPEMLTQPVVSDKEPQRLQRSNDYMECESVGNDSACCPTSCASGSVCYEENCPKQISKETVIPCTRDPCDEPGRISREGQRCLTKGIDVLKQIDWNRQAISDTRTAEWESTSWNPQFATQAFNMDNFQGNGIEALASMASMDMSSQQEHNNYMPGSPDAVTPSMGYECHTPYSAGPMSTPSFHHSTQPFQNESQSIAKDTGDMLDGAGQWQNMDCEWDQCHEPFSDPNQFQTHLHEKHLDPLIKWKCAMPSSDCGDIVADPVEHLRTVHTWTQSNCPGGCPPPLDIDPAYLHIHFDQEHSFLLQEGLPCKWASCDTRVEDFSRLSAHLNSQHGVNLPDMTDGDINLTSMHSSLPKHHSLQHELQPSVTNDDTGLNPSTGSNLSLLPEPSVVSTHGVCQWQMEDGRICGVVTTGQDQVAAKAMQKHVEEVHLTQLNSKKGYICQWKDCNRSAKMPPNKVAFTQRGKLGRHIHSHTGYKSEECPICHKQFSADQALKTHMNQHTKEKPWKCKHPGCSEEFASQSACTVHERIHTGEKPLKCPFCDMSFSDSSNLSKHRKTHVGEEGSYPCSFPGCTRLLTSRSHLQRHMDAMHGNKTGNDGVAKGRHNSRKVAVRGKKIKPESFDDDTSTSLASEADDKISVF